MLIASVSRNSVLSIYERSSSQDTAVKSSIERARTAESASHRHDGEFVHAEYALGRPAAAFSGVKSNRVKKYGCGRASGSRTAAVALREASGVEPNPFDLERAFATRARSGRGSMRANRRAR